LGIILVAFVSNQPPFPMNNELSNQLEKNFQELTNLLSRLNDEQWNAIPFKGSWTPAQLAEHLLKSYQVLKLFNGTYKKANRQPNEKIEAIKNVFLDMNRKMKSPKELLPSETGIDQKKLLQQLENITHQLVEFSKAKDLTITCLDEEMPGFGHLTILEWLNFINFHTQRHLIQLKKIIHNIELNQRELA
jgi:hypothetical protein